MMKTIKKQINYICLILFSICTATYYKNDTFYFGVKYLTSYRVIDMMISILFSFIVFKILLDNYYYMVLNKNNIIVRVGREKYNLIILKIIAIHTILLLLFNYIIDFILMGKIMFFLNLLNTLFSVLMVVVLPKRKEYDNELLIIIVISLILRLIFSNVLL